MKEPCLWDVFVMTNKRPTSIPTICYASAFSINRDWGATAIVLLKLNETNRKAASPPMINPQFFLCLNVINFTVKTTYSYSLLAFAPLLCGHTMKANVYSPIHLKM